MKTTSRVLTLQLGSVAALLLICIMIRPAGLAANDGFSYYGDYKATAVPYSTAFILYAFCLWRISETFGGSAPYKALRWMLRTMALMLIGLVITPSDIMNGIHTVFGATLFSLQLIFSMYVAGWLARDRTNITLTVLEFASGLASLYYLPKSYGLLLHGQAMFQLAFAALLIRFATEP